MQPITGANVGDTESEPPPWSPSSPAALHWYRRFTSTRPHLLREANGPNYSVAVRTWREVLTRAARRASVAPQTRKEAESKGRARHAQQAKAMALESQLQAAKRRRADDVPFEMDPQNEPCILAACEAVGEALAAQRREWISRAGGDQPAVWLRISHTAAGPMVSEQRPVLVPSEEQQVWQQQQRWQRHVAELIDGVEERLATLRRSSKSSVKEEGVVPPMPLDAVVKEESIVPPMPPEARWSDAIVKEDPEEAVEEQIRVGWGGAVG